MILSTQAVDTDPAWLLPALTLGIPAAMLLSVFFMRLVGSKLMNGFLPEFSSQPVAFDAEWRNPGAINIGRMSGNAFRFAMDDQYLHIVPMWPMRVFFGMTARSVPWSEIEVTRDDGKEATALLGGHAYVGPEWSVQRAAKRRSAG